MEMVYVPAGEFQMGSATDFEDEKPVHTVKLDGFWIDRTEVTNAQYAQCVAAGACEKTAQRWSPTRDSEYGDSAYDGYPVAAVRWYEVVNYCAWAGGRLPTEAEWEYAARGSEGQRYPWGDSVPDCDKANCSDCVGDTAAVGSYPVDASWCGALDMAGNVREWVADWYGPYPSGRQENPAGPASGKHRVMRGGYYGSHWIYARAAARHNSPPDYGWANVGFRCVSPIP
jgi:formylglycine-generating enzyme required for sulfatase activity